MDTGMIHRHILSDLVARNVDTLPTLADLESAVQAWLLEAPGDALVTFTTTYQSAGEPKPRVQSGLLVELEWEEQVHQEAQG